ncbi:MAG: hypothetical protein M5U28_01865 [Sandaracinaceae bacterium]|nr:hypothetical protein [Sandaracinaceae bacterium]
MWTQLSPAGESTLSAASGGGARGRAVFVGSMQAVNEIPAWLTDVLHSELDDHLLVAFAIVMLLAAVAGGGGAATQPLEPPAPRSARLRVALLSPLAAALYFVTPASYDWIWPINARFPLLAIVFAIVALPRQRGVLGAVTLSAMVIPRRRLQRRGEARLRGVRGGGRPHRRGDRRHAARRARGGAGLRPRLAPREVLALHPLGGLGAGGERRRGDVHVRRLPSEPPSPSARSAARRASCRAGSGCPHEVDPARDLAWYDYVLVRGGPGRIASQRHAFERVMASGPWSVWRRLPEAGGARPKALRSAGARTRLRAP